MTNLIRITVAWLFAAMAALPASVAKSKYHNTCVETVHVLTNQSSSAIKQGRIAGDVPFTEFNVRATLPIQKTPSTS